MKEKLTKLIDLKSIVTLLMVCGLLYGWFTDKVPVDVFIPFVSMILAFYFTKNKTGE